MTDFEQALRAALVGEAMRAAPPRSLSTTISRRARRARAAVVVGVVAALFVVAGAATVSVARLTNPRNEIAPAQAPPSGSTCPQVVEGGYSLSVDPGAAARDARVTVTGPIPMYDEQGLHRPPVEGDAMAFWLDADREEWQALIESSADPTPALEPDEHPAGGAVYLGKADLPDADGCTFRFRFDMPAVSSGRHSIVAVSFGGDGAAFYDDAEIEATQSSTTSSFACPHLIRPGRDARAALRPALDDYLTSRQPPDAPGYHYAIERLTRRVIGGPEGRCPPKTWRRSFQATGSFEYKKSVSNPSASLAFFRVVIGRTRHRWIVWAEPH